MHALDLLRGWAMFGVLYMNLVNNFGASDPNGALSFIAGWLLDHRFYTLLCLLFGIGFGIQLMRAADRGVDLRAAYYRRSRVPLAMRNAE